MIFEQSLRKMKMKMKKGLYREGRATAYQEQHVQRP